MLQDRAAVAHGLTIMITDMLFNELPALLARLVGEKQTLNILGMLAKRTASHGFQRFLEKLGMKPGSLTINQLLEIFVERSEKLHPFQIVTRVERRGDTVIMNVRDGEQNLAILAGVIAGVIEAGTGTRVQVLNTRDAARHLCHAPEKPEYIIYPESRNTLVLERLKC